MMLVQRIVLGLALAAIPLGALAQSRISPETLKKLKAGTVLVELTAADGTGGTGSGFVLEKLPADGSAPQGSVLVVTNAHVVQGEPGKQYKLQCVFHSGTPQEVAYSAQPVGVDEDRDLAVLKIAGPDLPEPLDVATEVEIQETLSIFTLGFPFGDLLATSRRRPAITISKGTISSIRRDDWNKIALIQVDGGISPGNSGGPVVNESGSLIGISVAKIRGSEIGFAIPKAELVEMLKGRISKVSITATTFSNTKAEFRFLVRVIDPKQKIADVEVWMVPKARISSPLKPTPDGRWLPIANDMEVTKLSTLRNGQTNGVVTVSNPRRGEEYLFQLRWKSRQGDVFFTAPAPIVLGKTGNVTPREHGMPSSDGDTSTGVAQGGSPQRGLPRLRESMPQDDNVYVESFDATITNVIVGGGGRYLILQLGSDDEAIVYDVKERKKVLTLSVPGEDVIVANMENIFVLSRMERRFDRWSLKTMTKGRKGKLPIDGPVLAAAAGMSSKGNILVCWAARVGGSSQLFYSLITPGSKNSTVINPIPTTRKTVKTYSIPLQVSRPEHGVQILASADGNTYALSRTRVTPTGAEIVRLRKEKRASATYDHQTYGHVMPTADGRWICTAKGMLSVDLVRSRGSDPTLASTHAKFFLAVSENHSFNVCDTSTGDIVHELPPLRELGDDLRALRQSKLTFYERFILIPQYDVFVTIPLGDDRIAIREVSLGVADTSAGETSADGTSETKITGEPYRTWKDRTGKYEVVAKLVSISKTHVTIERKEGNTVSVPISRLSDKDVQYIEKFK